MVLCSGVIRGSDECLAASEVLTLSLQRQHIFGGSQATLSLQRRHIFGRSQATKQRRPDSSASGTKRGDSRRAREPGL